MPCSSIADTIGRRSPRTAAFVLAALLLTGLTSLSGCTNHYSNAVREWAQPAKQLLATRVNEAMTMQQAALKAAGQANDRGLTGDARQAATERASLATYQFGQSILAIRDVLERQAQAGQIQSMQSHAALDFTDELVAVQHLLNDYVSQLSPLQGSSQTRVSFDDVQDAAEDSRDHARQLLQALQQPSPQG